MKYPTVVCGKYFILGLLLAAPWVTVPGSAAWRTETFAGTGVAGYSGDGGPAIRAQLNGPFGVVRGPDGCIYFCEISGNVVRKVDSRGIITTVAGTGRKGPGGDGGPAVKGEFNQPHEIRFDKAGNLYIVDMTNHRVRKVDMRTGMMSSVAGSGTAGFSGDGGPATKAELKSPISIQFDAGGDLYLCDLGNHRVRKVDMKSGNIMTVTGNGQRAPTPDGAPLANAPVNGPRTLDFDRTGRLWLVLRDGHQVLKIDMARGLIHHVAGTGKKGFDGDGGPARQAALNGPKGIAVSPDGTKVYLADTENHCIRLIDPIAGTIERVCGTGEKGDGPEGDARQCKLDRPHALFVDADGSLFISDSGNHRVRRLKQD